MVHYRSGDYKIILSGGELNITLAFTINTDGEIVYDKPEIDS